MGGAGDQADGVVVARHAGGSFFRAIVTRPHSSSSRAGRGGRVSLGVRGRAGTPTHASPGGTLELRVTTAPPPVRAPSPTLHGAIRIEPLPTKARSPITVWCFFLPS